MCTPFVKREKDYSEKESVVAPNESEEKSMTWRGWHHIILEEAN